MRKTAIERHRRRVYGYQKERKGGLLERITGKIVYYLFDLLLSYRIPLNAMTIRLMRKEYVDALPASTASNRWSSAGCG